MTLRARAGVWWARLGLRLFGSPVHAPGLLAPNNTEPGDAPFLLVGKLDGQKIARPVMRGADARTIYTALLERKPAGWLECRHEGVVRSRYER